MLIEFRDSSGQLVDVGNVRFEMTMNMPGMKMRDSGKIQSTGKPGQYRVKVEPEYDRRLDRQPLLRRPARPRRNRYFAQRESKQMKTLHLSTCADEIDCLADCRNREAAN